MRQLIEDLEDLGKESAWAVVQALSRYYRSGMIPAEIDGEIKLTVIGFIERGHMM